MNFIPTKLPGVVIIEPDIFKDDRGYFLETFQKSKYEGGGIGLEFVQHNHSHSTRGVLRGLHTQLGQPQGKLIRAIRGEIFDVAVDIQKGSPTYGEWVSVTLSGDNFKQLYVPPNFAHGFVVLSEEADIEYKCTNFYDPKSEITVIWNDPELNIDWPMDKPILSDKDKQGLPLKEFESQLPVFTAGS